MLSAKKLVHWLRLSAWVEGASFLVLLFVAMPLKYFAGIPEAVRVIGWVHGGLFIGFCLLLACVFFRVNWSVGRAALVFAAAWIPFGPFLIDRRMRGYEEEAGNAGRLGRRGSSSPCSLSNPALHTAESVAKKGL